MTIRRHIEDVVEHIPGVRKWYAWTTVRDEIDREAFERFWQESDDLPIGVPGFLGMPETRLGNFYKVKVNWEHDHAEAYYCTLDNCLILWYDGRVVMGLGPVGCSCDELDDPRGEKIEDN